MHQSFYHLLCASSSPFLNYKSNIVFPLFSTTPCIFLQISDPHSNGSLVVIARIESVRSIAHLSIVIIFDEGLDVGAVWTAVARGSLRRCVNQFALLA